MTMRAVLLHSQSLHKGVNKQSARCILLVVVQYKVSCCCCASPSQEFLCKHVLEYLRWNYAECGRGRCSILNTLIRRQLSHTSFSDKVPPKVHYSKFRHPACIMDQGWSACRRASSFVCASTSSRTRTPSPPPGGWTLAARSTLACPEPARTARSRHNYSINYFS
jgi:hypothetical protein